MVRLSRGPRPSHVLIQHLVRLGVAFLSPTPNGPDPDAASISSCDSVDETISKPSKPNDLPMPSFELAEEVIFSPEVKDQESPKPLDISLHLPNCLTLRRRRDFDGGDATQLPAEAPVASSVRVSEVYQIDRGEPSRRRLGAGTVLLQGTLVAATPSNDLQKHRPRRKSSSDRGLAVMSWLRKRATQRSKHPPQPGNAFPQPSESKSLSSMEYAQRHRQLATKQTHRNINEDHILLLLWVLSEEGRAVTSQPTYRKAMAHKSSHYGNINQFHEAKLALQDILGLSVAPRLSKYGSLGSPEGPVSWRLDIVSPMYPGLYPA
jgi:hypothetical protein